MSRLQNNVDNVNNIVSRTQRGECRCVRANAQHIIEKLGITDKIPFHRVHRKGQKQTKNRPIVPNLLILRTGKKLQKYSVFVQFAKDINDQRKLQYSHYKAGKRQGERVQLVVEKLQIKGKLFVLAEELQENNFLNTYRAMTFCVLERQKQTILH